MIRNRITRSPGYDGGTIAGRAAKPVELFVNISNSVLPLIVTGDATLDMSRGSMADFGRTTGGACVFAYHADLEIYGL